MDSDEEQFFSITTDQNLEWDNIDSNIVLQTSRQSLKNYDSSLGNQVRRSLMHNGMKMKQIDQAEIKGTPLVPQDVQGVGKEIECNQLGDDFEDFEKKENISIARTSRHEQTEFESNKQRSVTEFSEGMHKKFKIPNPDQVFYQLENQRNKNQTVSLKKIEENIAMITQILGQEGPTEISQKNERILEEERFSASTARQQVNVDKSRKTIYFDQNNEQKLEKQIEELPPIRESVETERNQDHNLQNQEDYDQGWKQNEDEPQTRDCISHFETIVAACLVKMEGNEELYAKYKFQLDDNSLTINKKLTIPIMQIRKINIIKTFLNRPEVRISFLMKFDLLNGKKEKKNLGRILSTGNIFQSPEGNSCLEGAEKEKLTDVVVILCDSYELMYTLYSSLIVRKLYKRGMIIPEPIQINSFLMPMREANPYKTEGFIFKLSKHRKKWELRFGEIQSYKYRSYQIKKQKEVKESMGYEIGKCTLKVDKIERIETKFELIQGKLICKIMSGREKVELGIPIHNYSDIFEKGNWLYGLLTVLRGPD